MTKLYSSLTEARADLLLVVKNNVYLILDPNFGAVCASECGYTKIVDNAVATAYTTEEKFLMKRSLADKTSLITGTTDEICDGIIQFCINNGINEETKVNIRYEDGYAVIEYN